MATLRPYEVVTVEHSEASRMRFRTWVIGYGFSRLARSLGVNRITVHKWLRSDPKYPHAPTVQKIIALSRLEPLVDGPLTYQDILGTVDIASQETRTEAREVSGPTHDFARRFENFVSLRLGRA